MDVAGCTGCITSLEGMTRISGALLPTQLIVGALTWRYANRLAVARNAGLPVAAKISNQPRDLRLPGAIAQLEEHLLCKQGVRGLSPLSSTTIYLRNLEVLRTRSSQVVPNSGPH